MNQLHRVSGIVLSADRQPVQGAFVTISSSTVRVPEIAIMTDGAGHFELTLPVGEFTLRAQDGHRVAERRLDSLRDSTVELIFDR